MWKSIATITAFFNKVIEICKQKVKKVTSPKLSKEQSLPKKKQSTNSHGKELWLILVDEVVILLCSFSHNLLMTDKRQKVTQFKCKHDELTKKQSLFLE